MADEPVTYEYRSGPSMFMSGESDWIIRRVGKPGIVASVIGHESHAKAAVDALNQVAKQAAFADAKLRENADRLAAALHYAIYGAHPAYGNTTGWRGGIGGQTVTQGCSFIDPPHGDARMTDALTDVVRQYLYAYPVDLNVMRQQLINDLPTPEGE